MRGPSPAAASGGHSSPRCTGLPPSRPLSLRSTGSRRAGSAIVAHGPSRSAACGIFPDQGPNPHPPHWQADSQPLRHQGSPLWCFHSSLVNTWKWNYWVIGWVSLYGKLPNNFPKWCSIYNVQNSIAPHPRQHLVLLLFFFKRFLNFIYLFIFGCIGSLLLHARFL